MPDANNNPPDKPAPPPNPVGGQAPGSGSAGGPPSQPSIIIALLNAIAPMVTGIAWPVAVLLLAWFGLKHADSLSRALDRFMQGKQSLEASVSTAGIEFKVLQGLKQQASAETGGAESVEKEFARWGVDVSAAICKLGPDALARKQPLAKVLWVDQHPGHNIGLEYAFGALGILVVDIDSNSQIDEAFRTASGFDLVITNVDRGSDPYGDGLKTVGIVKKMYPPTPIIVFSSGYARQYEVEHPGKPALSAPILAITYYTDEVFNKVIEVVANLNRHGQPCADHEASREKGKP